jgi:hypothetical protein
MTAFVFVGPSLRPADHETRSGWNGSRPQRRAMSFAR